MATALKISSSDSLLVLLHRSFPKAFPTTTISDSAAHSALELPSGAVQGSNTIASHLSPAFYPDATYTELEKAEINQWLTISAKLTSPAASADPASTTDLLHTLNNHLASRTTLLGSKPSLADAAIYARLALVVAKWTPEERTGKDGYQHIVRFIDAAQNAPLFGLTVPDTDKIAIDLDDIKFVHRPADPREEKERKKKEKAAAAAAAEGTPTAKPHAPSKAPVPPTAAPTAGGGAAKDLPNRPKKEKKPKAPPIPAAPTGPTLSPSLIDLRVGLILKATTHPNADSLYVSTIACGDLPGADNTSQYTDPETNKEETVRTVCSGLNGLVPLAEMQRRKVVVVCNLKPVKMRGVASAAMVLAASPQPVPGGDPHAGPVELVTPPDGASPGARVAFEGWEGVGEPEKQLNPKKKVWEMCQVGFTTNESGEVVFDSSKVVDGELAAAGKRGVARLVLKGGGEGGKGFTVKTLRGAVVR